jgi:replicative DNA helicase
MINVGEYAKMVVDDYRRRELVKACDSIRDMMLNSTYEDKVPDLISKACAFIEEVNMRDGTPEGTVTFDEALQDAMTDIYKSYQKGGTLGFSSGLEDVDTIIGGLKRGEVIVFGGRPGMGKTAIAIDIVDHVADVHEKEGRVLFFSQEMAAKQLALRRISKESNLSSHKLNNADLTPQDFDVLQASYAKLKNRKVIIDPASGITISHIASRLRQLTRRGKISVVVIDYLQLLKGAESSNRQKTRVNDLTEITAGLKTLAKQFDVCMLVVAQLKRESEPWNGKKEERKRPTMADLKDSSSIEQDADIVILLHREEYYLRKEQPKNMNSDAGTQWQLDMNRWKGLAEAIVDKNRNGSGGTALLGWDGHLTSFRNLEEDEKTLKDNNAPRAKPRLTNDAAPVYRSIQRSIADSGRRGACIETESLCVDYNEAFTTYFQSVPMVGVEDLEALEKKERTRFRDAIAWLRGENIGLIALKNYQEDGVKKAWLWLTEQGARV